MTVHEPTTPDELPEIHARLAELCDRWSASPKAGQPIREVVEEISVSPGARKAFRHIARRWEAPDLAPGPTVGEFLMDRKLQREASSHVPLLEVARALARWFESDRPAGGRSNRGPLGGESDRPARGTLRERIASARMPDLGHWTLGMLGGKGPFWATSLSALAASEERAGPGPSEEIVAQAHIQLDKLLPSLEALRAGPRKARAAPAPVGEAGPETDLEGGDAALARLIRAIARTRETSRETWPAGLVAASTDAKLVRKGSGCTVQLEVKPQGAQQDFVVETPDLPGWFSESGLRCSCRSPACVHRALALDWLLDGAAVPGGPVRGLLAAGLRPVWQGALDGFLAGEPAETRAAEKPGALSFELSETGCAPFLHKLGRRGKSRTGRRAARASDVLQHVSGQDRRVAVLLALAEAELGHREAESTFMGDALLALAGHPDVRWKDGAKVPVEIVSARVVADETGDALRFRLFAGEKEIALPDKGVLRCSTGWLSVVRQADRALLVQVPDTLLRFCAALRESGGSFPREALPQLLRALPRLEEVASVELPEGLRG
jgi:hypothetical protein